MVHLKRISSFTQKKPNGLLCIFVLILVLLSCSDLGSVEGEPSHKQISYSNEIQPIFNNYCIDCHGVTNTWSGLNLTSYNHLMNGGDNGPSVIPGNGEESLIVLKLGPEPPFGDQMPLQNPPLNDIQIDLIKNWINDGAHNN